MFKYIIALGVLFNLGQENLFGQSIPPIQLDRPDQTECPFITPKKYIQVENGFTFEKVDRDQQTFSYPSTLWKYGVNERFELRFITEFVSGKIEGKINSGILPVTVGFKTTLLEEKGLTPKTSFIGHLTTSNVGSKAFHSKYIAPSFRFTMQHTLSPKIAVAYNLGAEWNGADAGQSYIYTLTSGFTLTEKIGCYTELYGFLPNDSKPDHRFDCGFTYLVNNNFITDLSGGIGLTANAPKHYISLGISFRFKTTN